MRVLVICDRDGVSEFYRVATPYRMLAEAGLIEYTQSDGYNPAIIAHLGEFDAIVFSRSDSAEHALILLEAKQRGLRVIMDVDDNLLLIPPSIGCYGSWHKRGTNEIAPRLWYFKRNVRLADILTVTTPTLGRQLCDDFGLRPANDYMVLPNQIVAADWDIPAGGVVYEDGGGKKPGEVWVGWWGIYNHWDDWRDVAPYVEPVIAARPEVRLWLLGMPELAHLFPILRKQNQLIVGPFIAPDDLGRYRAIVKQFDVALAPTASHPFNESKSDLKILQYGAAGVPVIASAVTYGDWRQFVTAILDQPGQWGVALDWALGNLAEMRDEGRYLRRHVLGERTYEKNFTHWLEPLTMDLSGEVGKSEVERLSQYWDWVLTDEPENVRLPD